MPVAIDAMSDALQRCPHFDLLVSLCKDKNAYIVGGALRDALLHRPISDLDLIFPEDPTPLARSFAKIIGGHWFWLDRERRQSRVVLKGDAQTPFYDFAPFRAADLEQDLLDRDFTINALALPLLGSVSSAPLIDVVSGLEDLRNGQLRMVGKDAFRNDPLRIIKGVRHATVLGLEIEEQTLLAMQAGVAGLDSVAVERIRQEIWKILAHEHAPAGLLSLQRSGAGQQLFGAEFAPMMQWITGKLTACSERLHQLAHANPEVHGWQEAEIEQGLSNRTLLLWTVLLAAIEAELPVRIARQWRLSRKTRSNIDAIIALDEVAFIELPHLAQTERAYAWWAIRRRLNPRLLLLTLAAKSVETALPMAVLRSWCHRIRHLGDRQPTDLVDGQWLRDELKLEDGPEMSKALELLRNNEISGKVCTEQEARQFLCGFYHNKD